MIQESQHLNPNISKEDIEQVPIRKGFGEGLLALGEQNPQVVGLCADLTESTQMHLFKNKFPERFIEIGVAEQNLASVASGMSAMGKIPFISSYAMFSPGRNWEQIRTTICYNDRQVIIAGSHAGVSVGPDGGTHQAIEDIALMRVVPNMTVISPCDAIEAKKATIASIALKSPVYIRLAREKTPVITTSDSPFTIGKANLLVDHEGECHVGIIATGALVYKAVRVAQACLQKGIKACVLNVHTIKPLDEEAVLSLARKVKGIVTVEEHQVIGGLGGAVAEYLSGVHPTHIERIGVQGLFGQSGTPDELIEHYGMGEGSIMKAVEKIAEK